MIPSRFKNLVLCVLLLSSIWVKAQPCLTGWTYRVPVLINNTSGGALSNHQVALTLNAQQLIVKGKAKLDGGDIRFLDKNGSVLPFWINPEKYNSTAAEIWVKVNTIAAAQVDTIYLFYGEASSLTLSNGDLTFELFDDFIGSTINASKWTSCNGGSFTVAGGTATFGSTAASTSRSTLTAVMPIASPIIVEADVQSVSNGIGFIGQRNGNSGYALAYEDNGQPTMRMMKFQSDPDCFSLANINPPNNKAVSANETNGMWSFTWFSTNNQKFAWPGQTAVENRSDVEFPLPATVSVTLGNINKVGSLELDWVRARKYTTNQPTTSLGTEVTSIFTVSASATDTVCENGTILIKASAIAGATYNWAGPNGYTSTDQNPIITSAALTMSGTYTVTATIPNSCSSASASVDVVINPSTVAGILSGDSTICELLNSGNVRLNGQTGNIVKWESSPTGLAPWTTIDETVTTLVYEELVNTTFYRAIVKSGVCNTLPSNEVKITVSPSTNAGRVLGTTEKCTQVNNGELIQVEHTGDIQRWQFSIDSGATWKDVFKTTETLSFNNLTTTTWYRTEIKSGVCNAFLSDSAQITIHPLPQVSFNIADTCEGYPSRFTNTTTILSGTVDHYEWDFSTGESSVSKNPLYQFPNNDFYTITLAAESNKGCKAAATGQALVNPLPTVNFSFEDVCDRNSVSFIQQSFMTAGVISTYNWNFGDDTGTSTDLEPSYLYATEGNFKVALVVTSTAGCVDSISKTVSVFPRAKLEIESDSVFLGQQTSFVNNSTINGGNLTFEWRFGDGDISKLVSPTHKYKSAGDFTATLISTTNKSCKDTLQQTVRVLADAKASFTVENVCKYDSASFVNTSIIATGTMTYKWNFGDGSTSILEHPKHLFATPNTYLVTLVATSDFGSESTFSDFVVINPIPQAKFSVANVCDEIEANFNNISTLTTGTSTYEWEFGDGATSVEEKPSHLYSGDGPYTIQLIATSEFDCKDTATVPVTVFPRPQTNFSVNNACDGFPSFFKDETLISSGSVISHTWDFGDGTNSIEQNPEKQFLNPKTYAVKLITNSDKNCPNDTTIIVRVIKAPVANFSFNNECDGVPISFTNTSISEEGQVLYTWAFDDGDSSSAQSPRHLYPTNGTYSVTLIAGTEFGCGDTIKRTIQVYANPIPKAGEDQTVSKGFSVTLSVTGSGNFIWTPEGTLDNQTATNPVATPLETTTYLVSVTDSNSCTGSDEVTVTVENDYIVLASNVITPDGNGQNDMWFVENITAYDDSRVVVFDRWGKKLYEQTAYQNDWVGVSKTDILPDGEYYYIITFTGSEKVYKGTITLIRGN